MHNLCITVNKLDEKYSLPALLIQGKTSFPEVFISIPQQPEGHSVDDFINVSFSIKALFPDEGIDYPAQLTLNNLDFKDTFLMESFHIELNKILAHHRLGDESLHN